MNSIDGAEHPPAGTATDVGPASAVLPISDGVYRTAPRRIPLLARLFPSVVFYLRFFLIIWKSSALAKRGRYGDREWVHSSLSILRALESVGVRVEITGLEHLRSVPGPCVVVANHMSTLETGVLPCVIQPIKQVTFVVKSSLLTYPIFKYIMRSRDPIAVTQTNPRADLKTMLTEGVERLKRGISVVVFPEGTRTSTFDPAKFNSIGVKIAQRAETSVTPLALQTDAWSVGKLISDVGRINPAKKVRFAFGPPLWVQGRSADSNQAIVDFISQQLCQWQTEDAQP